MTFKSISLRRTPCYGECPVYHFHVNKDGVVKYFELSEIESENQIFMTCSPTCVTEVILQNGIHRKIENDSGCPVWPAKLTQFEKSLEKIVEVGKYIKKRPLKSDF
jgi:hypothetical protein